MLERPSMGRFFEFQKIQLLSLYSKTKSIEHKLLHYIELKESCLPILLYGSETRIFDHYKKIKN